MLDPTKKKKKSYATSKGKGEDPARWWEGRNCVNNQILYPPEMLSGFKQNLVYTGLRHLTETGPDLPLSVLSVSCGDTGQQWPVTGAEALGEANLGHTACGISCF